MRIQGVSGITGKYTYTVCEIQGVRDFETFIIFFVCLEILRDKITIIWDTLYILRYQMSRYAKETTPRTSNRMKIVENEMKFKHFVKKLEEKQK